MKRLLADITTIRFGLYSQPEQGGTIAYCQVRNFDERGQWVGPADLFLPDSPGPGTHLLRPGDVLFAGKGFRQFAWAYDPAIGPAVASSSFFVIRPDPVHLSGAYLAAYFNTPAVLAYFTQLSAGTNIPSIRKSELEALEIPLPPLQRQHQIARLYRLNEAAIRLQRHIGAMQDQYFQAVLKQLAESD